MKKQLYFILILYFIASHSFSFCIAQTPVKVGSGSYASSLPPNASEFWAGLIVNVKNWHDTVPLFVMDGVIKPIPTNKWWSSLMFHNNVQHSYNLWAQPLNITVEKYGVGLHFADTWTGIMGTFNETSFIQNPDPVQIKGQGFIPVEQRVKTWGDWTVQFRVLESATKYMDVTMGHGLPYLWVEYTGITNPQINTPGASYFDDNGNTISFPYTGDHIGIIWQGRNYGLFASDGTVFSNSNGLITLSILTDKKYVTVAAMTSKNKLSYFHQYAYSVPRNSKMDWVYNKESGKVITNWTLETELLKGTEHAVIQGWIPHHYRNTNTNFSFDGNEYVTARGKMKCAPGTIFQITYNFNGVLTNLPVPEQTTFDRNRMSDYVNNFSSWNYDFNSETYAGGKQVAMFARQLCIAKQLNNPKASVLKTKLKGELENFFTYTGGESEKCFAYSDRFGGLIGFNCGFGSHRFNDHHFHYGYYVYSAGILSQYDTEFATQYGEMAKLVAKEYANWDRTDARFPVLRTLDIWEGHSWAGGGSDNSDVFGENQESTSEAMMSWAGIVTLGNALNDPQMTSAGILGYAMEGAAVNEYWFNRNNDNFPATYGPAGNISCITWSNQIQYITYFGPEPIFVHGIQYMPILPSSYYLVQTPTATSVEFNYLLTNSNSDKYTRFKTPDSWESQWANEVMRYASLFNPNWSVDWFEQLWANKDPKATDLWESGMTYYTINANKNLGAIQWNSYIATPNSGVFYNTVLNQYTYCAFNTTNTVQSYNVYRSGQVIGQLRVPANTFYSTHSLDGNLPPDVSIISPIDGSTVNIPAITLTANASDPDGSIAKVEFYNGNSLITTINNAPYTFNWSNLKDGTYSIVAKAYDNQNLSTYSNMISFNCDLPADTCKFTAANGDFTSTMTGKANPTISFKPGSKIVGCTYVIATIKVNGTTIGAFYMTKGTDTFTKSITANIDDKVEWFFTYQTPPAGEKNNISTPCSATVGGCNLATGLSSTEWYDERNTLSIFPNPSNGIVNIYSTGYYSDEPLQISVSDFTGRTVYKTISNADKNGEFKNTIQLKAENLSGLYFIFIHGKSTTNRNRFLISN